MAQSSDMLEGIRRGLREVLPGTLSFPDRCSLVVPGAGTPDGFGGTTETETVVAQDIPLRITVLGRSDQVIGGALLSTQTHKLTMGSDDSTKQIASHYRIVVQAQHGISERIFENPVLLMGSSDVLVKVAAALKG